MTGETPLDADEAADLIPSHLATQAELNAWEQANIVAALPWARRQRRSNDVLTVEFARELHRRMFGETWKWAGTFRKTAETVGVPAARIAEGVANLLRDAGVWIGNKTYSPDEIAARFHHRLVSIHPFPNGNGRHARLMADALLLTLGAAPFSWGSGNLDDTGGARNAYLRALRKADGHDYSALLAFVRT